MTDPLCDRALVDPETLAVLDAMPAFDVGPDTLAAVRAGSTLPLPGDAPPVPVDMVEEVVPGIDGGPDVPVLVYRPAGVDGALGCILHIHGGGYVAGTAAAMAPAERLLAAQLGCVIVSVDYRLAPEAPYPAALDDCHAALEWTFDCAATLEVDPARIGVMGESAGGGLAAALALRVRDAGRRRLAFQHLVYPMLDDRTCTTADPHPLAGRRVWTRASNAFGWTSLLGVAPGSDDVPYLAAPGRCADLSGLPPTFVATGALDLFVDEDLDYARRLARAGVPVELVLYPGAVHGFDLVPGTALAARARADRVAALARALTYQIA